LALVVHKLAGTLGIWWMSLSLALLAAALYALGRTRRWMTVISLVPCDLADHRAGD